MVLNSMYKWARENLTPIQFLWIFKKIFFLNFYKHSEGSNCLNDMAEVLTTIGYIYPPLSKSCVLIPEKTPFDFFNLQVGTTDYRELYFPFTKHPYLCLWLFNKKMSWKTQLWFMCTLCSAPTTIGPIIFIYSF